VRGPYPGLLANDRDRHDAGAGTRERLADSGTDTTGTDHADIEPCGSLVGRSHAPNLSRTFGPEP
jgi:hypothetical protein